MTPAVAAQRALLARLVADPRVRAAAVIGDTFGIDPVAVLEERDPFKRLVRLAANNLLNAERERASKP